MAMSNTGMSSSIRTAIGAAITAASPGGTFDPALLTQEALWDTICQEIIDHVINNIEINTEIPASEVIVAATGGVPNASPIANNLVSVS